MKRFKLALIIFSGILAVLTPLEAQAISFCKANFESLPIQQGGRVKPLYVHAGEVVKHLIGKSKHEKLGAVETYCQLSFKRATESSEPKLQAKVEHSKVREFLGLSKGVVFIDYEELLEKFPLMRIEHKKQKEETSYKKYLGSLLNKAYLYKEIAEGSNWMLFEGGAWTPLNIYLGLDKAKALKTSTNPNDLNRLFMTTKDQFIASQGDGYLLELSYAKARLPLVSLLLTMLALLTLVGFKKFNIALALSGSTLLVQTALLTLRVIISGRAPITNMYETVLFSGYGALVLAMALGHFKKERIYVFIGLAYNLCSLMMLNFAGGMLSSSIGPLVPVLRDNFWLSTHVTTIIMSYGALALSWILANHVLFKRKFSSLSAKDEKYYGDLIYTCLKWGTTMLAAGILLGGVWADYSWGRFWGWDPKETWSLIVLLFYMAILHGRYTQWINLHRFFMFTAAAFMSVIMAWFGVNYILAAGLHSYGFSEGGAIFIGSLFAAQTIFLLVTYKSKSVD